MRHFRRLLAKLSNFVFGDRAERDLNREITAHITLLEDEYERRGMNPQDARFAARRAYGSVEQAKQLHREERSVLWLEQALQDVRYAFRSLWKTPGFAAVAVLTLALGIGANVAIFTVVNAVLLQPLPFQQPERLVRVFDDLNGAGAKDVGISVPEIHDLRDRSGVFDHISAIWPVSTALSGIRMALGAQPRDIMLLAFRPGVTLTLTGVVTGLIGALGAAHWMRSLLFGVSPSDPLTFAGVPVTLALIALLACWIPARRAVRIPPVIALRS